MSLDVPGIFYALVVAGGGIFGFVKAGSLPSLIAGLLFGVAIGLGSYLIYQNAKYFYLSLAASVTLAVFMGYRYYKSEKFMPSGLLCILSIAMALWYGINGYFSFKKSDTTFQSVKVSEDI